MDFDNDKTKTLLFFFEYVIARGEPQRLKDLSRHFGNERKRQDISGMRKITGKSLVGEPFTEKS